MSYQICRAQHTEYIITKRRKRCIFIMRDKIGTKQKNISIKSCIDWTTTILYSGLCLRSQ